MIPSAFAPRLCPIVAGVGRPTPNENLLYLMSELEQAVKRPGVKWSAVLVADLQRRLAQLVISNYCPRAIEADRRGIAREVSPITVSRRSPTVFYCFQKPEIVSRPAPPYR
jgi:hypothetical protein